MRLISGDEKPVSGTISVPAKINIGVLRQNHFQFENISVIVGPHLTKNSFEVQEDFIDNLRVKVENFKKYIFQFNSRTFFDFSKLIESEIIKLKIRKYRISNEDTFSNSDKYFSHRYCKVNKIKNCGRQISVVGIKK